MQCGSCGSLLKADGLPVVPDLAQVLADVHGAADPMYMRPLARDGLAIIAAAHAAQNSRSTTAPDVPRQEVES